jgi:hypothetical protein
MNCHIEWVMGYDAYEVTLWQARGPGMFTVAKLRDGEVVFEDVPQGAKLEPSFRMPGEMLQAFGKAAAKLPSPELATVEHLEDAKAVRDRLLRIVEHKMGVQK